MSAPFLGLSAVVLAVNMMQRVRNCIQIHRLYPKTFRRLSNVLYFMRKVRHRFGSFIAYKLPVTLNETKVEEWKCVKFADLLAGLCFFGVTSLQTGET